MPQCGPENAIAITDSKLRPYHCPVSESHKAMLSNHADLRILKPILQRGRLTIDINPRSCVEIYVSIPGESVSVQSRSMIFAVRYVASLALGMVPLSACRR